MCSWSPQAAALALISFSASEGARSSRFRFSACMERAAATACSTATELIETSPCTCRWAREIFCFEGLLVSLLSAKLAPAVAKSLQQGVHLISTSLQHNQLEAPTSTSV